MNTFQEQFQQYIGNTYYPNDPTLNQDQNFNIVKPINTFDISSSLKRRLKKDRKTISPIRQYANDTLQFDETTGTGNYDFNDFFKVFNTAAQGITGLANANNDAKNRRLEEQIYLQSLIPKPSFNYNEDGLNNIPMYKLGGKNQPSANKAREILHDGEAHGKKLTDKQRKFFGAISNKKQDGGWHHNVDNIPFPINANQISNNKSLYFPETFIGPSDYPVDMQGTDYNWTFTPVRKDYNQKYIPYQANYNNRPYILKKEFNDISKKSTIDTIINTAQELGVTTPKNTPITGKKIFMDPNNPTLATPQNDIWNNPNGSDPLIKPVQKPKRTDTVADWFQSGGYNEGDEIELTQEEIKELQKKGYRFEIL